VSADQIHIVRVIGLRRKWAFMKAKTIGLIVIVAGTSASFSMLMALKLGVENYSGMIGGGVGGAVAAVMYTMAQRARMRNGDDQ